MPETSMRVELVQMTDPKFADIAAGCCTHRDIPDVHHTYNRLRGACFSGHFSILEHIVVTFEISGISRACSHQLVRHRVASYAQSSQRCVDQDSFDYVMPESMKGKTISLSNSEKEGATEIDADIEFRVTMAKLMATYNRMIAAGVPAEDARYILPNACCTNIVVTMNLREASHFCALRRCSRTQWELREVADRMAKQITDRLESYGVECLEKLFEPACAQNGYCKEQHGCKRKVYYNALEDSFYKGYLREELRKSLERSEKTN